MGELLAGGTILFTVLIICGSVLFSLLITAAAIGVPIYFFRQSQKRTEELMKVGTQGEATILSLEDTGMLVNHSPRVVLLLEVRIPMRETYQVKKTITVPLIRLAQIQVGSVVQVMVDLSDMRNPEKIGLLLK